MTNYLREKWIAFRVYCAIVWFRWCRFLSYFLRWKHLRPTSEFYHKLIVIGDDFGAGIGDYVSKCGGVGLAPNLKSIISESSQVRHNWDIINAALPDTLSGDWTPSSSTKYYDSVFNSPSTRDAEVVLLMVGSIELKRAGTVGKASESIVKNIIDICDTLRKKGKRVCIASLADPSPLGNPTSKLPVNESLKEFCSSTKDDELPVVFGPRLDDYIFKRDDALAYDDYHFNSKAYRNLARNAADLIIPILTTIEWKTWKNKLNKVEYDASLYD